MKKILFSCLLCFLVFSCVSTEKLITDKTNGRVFFGKTGGFTNIPMEYVLFDKGQLFKIQDDSLFIIKKLRSTQIKNLEMLRKEIDFKQLTLNEPGNITYFLKVVTVDFEKEIKWNDSSDNIKIKEYYNALLATIKE